MVYGFVPPDIFNGKTSQLEIDFVEFVVSDTEEDGFAAWHADPEEEAGKQIIITEPHSYNFITYKLQCKALAGYHPNSLLHQSC